MILINQKLKRIINAQAYAHNLFDLSLLKHKQQTVWFLFLEQQGGYTFMLSLEPHCFLKIPVKIDASVDGLYIEQFGQRQRVREKALSFDGNNFPSKNKDIHHYTTWWYLNTGFFVGLSKDRSRLKGERSAQIWFGSVILRVSLYQLFFLFQTFLSSFIPSRSIAKIFRFNHRARSPLYEQQLCACSVYLNLIDANQSR